MAIWKTPANTNKQIKRISKNGTYSVEEGSGLYLRKKDNSLYFEGRIRSVSYTHLRAHET